MLPSSLLRIDGGPMLARTVQAFEKRLDYNKNKDGSWRVEFHGAVDVVVEAATLDECRDEADQVFDQKLAELVVVRGRKRNAEDQAARRAGVQARQRRPHRPQEGRGGVSLWRTCRRGRRHLRPGGRRAARRADARGPGTCAGSTPTRAEAATDDPGACIVAITNPARTRGERCRRRFRPPAR